jgi:SAM-dependent methyltransferase
MAYYDRIGVGYTTHRGTDPRVAAAIWAALGDARTVVNVGAGSGHYEPPDREVVAVEPSEVMIAQRPPGAAPVVQATAEALPFADGAFDAAMVVLSDHHWTDNAAGFRELRRVARRVVVFTYEPAWLERMWVHAYVPFAIDDPPTTADRAAIIGARVEPVPIPHDCQDGFFHAYWRRPQAYLDPSVRANISIFDKVDAGEGLARLAADLDSGAWEAENGHLLELDELDCGYRLIVA